MSDDEEVEEWQEIKVREEFLCFLSDDNHALTFEGWDDREDLLYQTLSEFSALIGCEKSVEEIKNLIKGKNE